MTSLADLVARYGYTSKLVRAYCHERGWKHTPTGVPAAWYDAWPAIAAELASVVPVREHGARLQAPELP